MSLDTTPQKPVWQLSPIGLPLFRVLCNVSSSDPINFKSFYLLQAFPICNDIPGITAMIPFPWVNFICFLVFPAIILWTKEVWVYYTPSTPVQIFPFPPTNSVGQSSDCLTSFSYLPRASGQGNIIALTRGRSPSVDDNTHIPEDRTRGPCIFISLTSLMSSLDHLRGLLSASWDGCFSRARLQLHHCTVDILHNIWSKTLDVTRI